MRLLQRQPNGEIRLTDRLQDKTIPRYAILSHTWGTDGDEVTFDDMVTDVACHKIGYEKIQFCAEQAANDGLDHFWVDTCCIDKSKKAELQHAISSMFRWYQRSDKCYVYLSDVSVHSTSVTWEEALMNSRWFTRGWTLQELLAPASVEFFSNEGMRLGDKASLEQNIQDITGVPVAALQGRPLFRFSVNERLSWIELRQTKIEEDQAYSMLGIFGVDLQLRYSEGKSSAFARLDKEIEKLEKCLQDLRLNNPYNHKQNIEHRKGGLLQDSYRWILHNNTYLQWHQQEASRLLWIRGDPGKGKTMSICGIIDDLSQSTSSTTLLTYFFCEATNSQINTATAVLRGLIYMLVLQQPSLALHIRRKYDHAGKAIFEDSDAWFALSEMFTDIMQDPYLVKAYLIIDALDECISSDLPRLLNFIIEKSSLSARVKWIVTSRNWPLIEERMEMVENRENLRLELNAESVSAAVDVFIRHKVQQLGRSRKYSRETQDAIFNHLATNADSTFLWVSLVCENLKSTPQVMVRARLKLFPPGLHALYSRMMVHISESEEPVLCKRILAIVSTVYRPLSLTELALLVDMLEGTVGDVTSFGEVIGLCGSFLVVRDRMVNFVHQSAKDYLLEKRYTEIFPTGIRNIHCMIFSQSLSILSATLKRNIYNLNEHGYPVDEIEVPDPDPLEGVHYACLHWIDHFIQYDLDDAMLDDVVETSRSSLMEFLTKNYLYWLEAVSICRGISEVVSVIVRLDNMIQVRGVPMLSKLVHDIRRHIFTYKHIIALAPLQVYVSSLVFSPRNSLIKHYFNDLQPSWITIRPSIMPHLSHWDQCLQSLEGHLRVVYSATFSTDGTRIASASFDDTIRIWDAVSGECEQILKNRKTFESAGYVAVFLHDSDSLASALLNDICVWQISSGECVKTLQGHPAPVSSLAFSPVLDQLASGSCDGTIRLWNVAEGTCLRTMETGICSPQGVAFSSDSACLFSQSQTCGGKFCVWDVRKSAWIALEGHDMVDNKVAISQDLTQLASSSLEKVRIWNIPTGRFKQSFNCSAPIGSMVFLHQPMRLALSFLTGNVAEIWDTDSGSCLQRLAGHSASIYTLAFSQKSLQLLTASADCTIRVWDVCGDFEDLLDNENCGYVEEIAFSDDSQMIAIRSADTIKIWDTDRDDSIQTIHCSNRDHSLRFSRDSTRLYAYRSRFGFDTPDRSRQDQSLVSVDISRGCESNEFSYDNTSLDDLDHQEPDDTFNALWVDAEYEWISHELADLVWLPPSVRPSKWKVQDHTMVFSTITDMVWWCKIDVENVGC